MPHFENMSTQIWLKNQKDRVIIIQDFGVLSIPTFLAACRIEYSKECKPVKALKPKHECEEVEVDAPAYHPYGFVY